MLCVCIIIMLASWCSEIRSVEHGLALVPRQEAGDFVYVPASWGHSALNLETTIGIAIGIHQGSPRGLRILKITVVSLRLVAPAYNCIF